MTAPTFINLGFEDADDTTPGAPFGWDWRHRVTSFKVAGFGAPISRFEDFDRGWVSARIVLLDDSDAERAHFVTTEPLPKYIEDFETNWNNDQHILALESAAAPVFSGASAPHAFEDFEHAWAGNTDYAWAFNLAALAAAAYAPTGDLFEAFDLGWRSNDAFVFSFAPANLSPGLFNAGPVETFEHVKLDVAFFFDLGSGRVSAPGHGFVEGDLVSFYALDDGLSALPAGLVPSWRYRVHSPTYADFLLQDETGTLAVVATTPGTGSIFVKADTRSHWTTSMDA